MKNKPLLIVILVALVVGVAGFAFFSGRVNPERELLAAERNMKNLDSYSVDFEMIMESEDVEGINMVLSGVADVDQVKKEGRGELNLNLVDMGVNLGASLVYFDGNLYGRATTFPAQFLPISAQQIEMLTENDVLLVENLPKMLRERVGEVAEGEEEVSFEELIAEIESLSEKIWEEAVSVTGHGRDDVNGVKARKYTLDLDSEKMVEFMIDLMEEYDLFESVEGISEEEAAEIKEEMEREMIEVYKNMEVYVWTDGEYILKVSVFSATELDQQNLEEEQASNEEMEPVSGEVKTVFEMTYSNFNQDFKITAPENYITLEDVMQHFFLPFPVMELY